MLDALAGLWPDVLWCVGLKGHHGFGTEICRYFNILSREVQVELRKGVWNPGERLPVSVEHIVCRWSNALNQKEAPPPPHVCSPWVQYLWFTNSSSIMQMTYLSDYGLPVMVSSISDLLANTNRKQQRDPRKQVVFSFLNSFLWALSASC